MGNLPVAREDLGATTESVLISVNMIKYIAQDLDHT